MPGSASRHSRSARDALVPLLDAIMFVAWAGPLVNILLASRMVTLRGIHYPITLVAGIVLAAAASKALPGQWGHKTSAALGVVASVAAAIYLVIPSYSGDWSQRLAAMLRDARRFKQALPTFTITVVMTALCWKKGLGLRRGHKLIWQAFSWGIGVLGVLMLLGPALAGKAMPHLVLPVFALLLSGLLATALSAQTRALANPYRRTDTASSGSRQWLIAMGLTVLGIVLVGWLLGMLLSPEQMKRAIEALRPLAMALWRAIDSLIVGVAYLAFLLLARILSALQLGDGAADAVAIELERGIQDQFGSVETASAMLPEWWQVIIRGLLPLGFLGGIAALLWSNWRKRRATRIGAAEEERTSILSGQLVLDQLERLWQRLTTRRAKGQFMDLDDADGTRRMAREAYQRLISLAQDHGHPRPRGTTPSDYETSLSPAFPGHHVEIACLTTTYQIARYAAIPPTTQQARAATEAVERIERETAQRDG